jgi:transposase
VFTSVRSSFLSDLTLFVVGLERERKPLEAAITEIWSNGRVEGQVNRLKLIKRQGFGRAGFELLRKRVLAA